MGNLKVSQTGQFKRDLRQQQKRGKNMAKLKAVVELLIAGEPLSPKNRDHALTGNWTGWRDCHVEPDWLLIYKILPEELVLGRTGTHADLF